MINELEKIQVDKPSKSKKIVSIDKFELSDVLSDTKLIKLINILLAKSKSGVGFIISCTPQTIVRLFSLSDKLRQYSKVFNVPKLTFNQAKQLIIIRLNNIRKQKSNSLSPFNEHQIKDIWKTSNGNPRMILLLCASLYEILKKRG